MPNKYGMLKSSYNDENYIYAAANYVIPVNDKYIGGNCDWNGKMFLLSITQIREDYRLLYFFYGGGGMRIFVKDIFDVWKHLFVNISLSQDGWIDEYDPLFHNWYSYFTNTDQDSAKLKHK